ncbi:hypothetical protein [Sphingomonas soli]|uniref:hypothetical protein n=1 Tax=Sphingomonas soli TaxID=266127 RepID=UPI0012EED819|nr:hypothetical protein [Sphingomonas soli]
MPNLVRHVRRIRAIVPLTGILALSLASPALAHAQSAITTRIDAAIDLCRSAVRGGFDINGNEAKAAGFSHDPARKTWNANQGANIVAIKADGFSCEVLLIGPDAQPIPIANHLAQWGARYGFDLDHYPPALQKDVLLDGSNGGAFLELKKGPNGILILTLSREGV